MLSDGEDEGLTSARHDNGVLKEDHVWILFLVTLGVGVGALLLSIL